MKRTSSPVYNRSECLRLRCLWGCVILLALVSGGLLLHRDRLNRELIEAVRAGNVQGVRQALQAGADPDTCIDGRSSFWDRAGWATVLTLAIIYSSERPQNEAIVRMLLEAGADVHEKNGDFPGDREGGDAVSVVKPREGAPPLPRGVVELVMQYANRKR